MGRALTGSDATEASPPAEGPSPLPRRILLVGFMGSGKTTVGRLLANEIGWRFVDLDEVIELEQGKEIPQIFREDGEEGFRRVEHALAEGLLVQDGIVLAPGGGWPCQEGRLEGAGSSTLSIWLQVSPEGVLDRVRGQPSGRPLLEVPDPLERIRALLAERVRYYQKAQLRVDTECHSPQEVVRRVTDRLRTDPERPLRA